MQARATERTLRDLFYSLVKPEGSRVDLIWASPPEVVRATYRLQQALKNPQAP